MYSVLVQTGVCIGVVQIHRIETRCDFPYPRLAFSKPVLAPDRGRSIATWNGVNGVLGC